MNWERSTKRERQMEIIDSYTHCGLSKYKPIGDVEDAMKFAGVSRAVLVQHLGEFDNSYIESIVKEQRERFAGVCLVDHESPDAEDQLARLADGGNFKGVRFTVDTLDAAPRLWDTAAGLGMVLVLYAPDGMANHVASLREFLDRHNDCRMVLTHLGNPSVDGAPESEQSVLTLAEYPGVYFQVSGMKMFCPYPHEPLYPLVAEAAARFGGKRLLWGSNYPVVGDRQDYRGDLQLLLDGKLPVPDADIPAIAGGNALSLWF